MKDLRQALLGYAAAWPAERQTATRMIELLAGGQPFHRQQFDPGHFTASAFVLSPDRRSLALIFHAKLQRWLQPGGHVEADDGSMAEAARREAAEECCMAPEQLTLLSPQPFDLDIHTIPARRDEPAHEHFDVRYLFVAESETGAAGDGVTGFRFVALDRVVEAESDASVMRAVERLKGL